MAATDLYIYYNILLSLYELLSELTMCKNSLIKREVFPKHLNCSMHCIPLQSSNLHFSHLLLSAAIILHLVVPCHTCSVCSAATAAVERCMTGTRVHRQAAMFTLAAAPPVLPPLFVPLASQHQEKRKARNLGFLNQKSQL